MRRPFASLAGYPAFNAGPVSAFQCWRRWAEACVVSAADNSIGDEGAAALAQSLEKNTTLTSIDLRSEPPPWAAGR